MRNFENWDMQDLEIIDSLEQVEQLSFLNDWLDFKTTFTQHEITKIESLRDKLTLSISYWNEDELKTQFIALLLSIVDFDIFFAQRLIQPIQEKLVVDFLISKGKQKPIPPYYFIGKFKQKGRKKYYEPQKELLYELKNAQECNNHKFPIYGCYVVERYWYFVILDGKKYAVSNAFNASDDDIFKIIAILRQVKVYIEQINGN